jgi:hypothetical protein
MGLFFEERTPNPEVVNLIASALQAQPPADGTTGRQAADLAGHLRPLVQTLATALDTPASASPSAEAVAAAKEVVNELLGGPSFNTGRFVIALSIFVALVGGGIATEATHLATASGTLFGFAGAIFGIVTAFLGIEKGSS